MSAFELFPNCAWLTIACDLPFVSNENVLALLKARDLDCDVTTYRANENYYETTFTIYETSVYPKLLETERNGDYSLQKVLRSVSIKAITPENDRDVFNVNDNKDLELVRQLKKR